MKSHEPFKNIKRQNDPYGNQGDKEVNKKDETKQYIFKQIAQYFSLKTNLLQGLKKWK